MKFKIAASTALTLAVLLSFDSGFLSTSTASASTPLPPPSGTEVYNQLSDEERRARTCGRNPYVRIVAGHKWSTGKNPYYSMTQKSEGEVRRLLSAVNPIFPLANARKLRRPFGVIPSRFTAGKTAINDGIDITAPIGTPVLAAFDGEVMEYICRIAKQGNAVEIHSSERGVSANYHHMTRVFVKKGQRVKKGEIIGTVGDTGYAAALEPYLHFTMGFTTRRSSHIEYFDPMLVLGR